MLLGYVLGEEGCCDGGVGGVESGPKMLPRSIGANVVMVVAVPLPRLLPCCWLLAALFVLLTFVAASRWWSAVVLFTSLLAVVMLLVVLPNASLDDTREGVFLEEEVTSFEPFEEFEMNSLTSNATKGNM